ncbi:MAG: TonB family protein [Proteobacteria bacterium]|nr:TonB family protein [Pseudomonadota bacterium]
MLNTSAWPGPLARMDPPARHLTLALLASLLLHVMMLFLYVDLSRISCQANVGSFEIKFLNSTLVSLPFKWLEYSDWFKKHCRRPSLDVILVNSKSAHPPSEDRVFAQVNLQGGGNSDENLRTKTPLPVSQMTRVGDDLLEAQRRVAELEAIQRKLLTQASSARSTRSDERKDGPQPRQEVAQGFELASRALAIARLEGEISRDHEEQSKRPRKKFPGASATEHRFAQYIEDWRQKIERIGNLNYPEAAKGKLYGTLVITVEINADGTVALIEIDRSSGKKILDEAALRIVRLAGPYAAFPPNIRRDTDVIAITRTWSFTQADMLQAN